MPRLTIYLIALLIVGLDQATKHLVIHRLYDGTSIELIPNFLYFTRTANSGSAFGLFPSATMILAVAAFVAATVIVGYISMHTGTIRPMLGTALALPLGGALGNFIDRVRLGHVTDFIDMRFGSYPFPVFNVADMSICIGVGLLALYFLRQPNHETAQEPLNASTK